ncbi:zona pellucida sperm-binding protein 3-like [Antennarius striatus]|uniref:zona pellucida sperm-binding protein 3-like n=1 Tax=Antennarius striatus TaxID=241820 RepID=UPI0035B1DF31
MDTLLSWINLFVGLLLSGICVRSSFAFPPNHYIRHAVLERPRVTKHILKEQQKVTAESRNQMNTVRVSCYPDSMEIVIEADMFGIGAPVDSDELRLGVELSDFCRATASSEDEYRIVAGLVNCGTKHWMTKDSLIYTNLLIYSPAASPDGLIRMDQAVIPIECHYERKYNLSSSSLMPTWIPFTSTQAAVETLAFGLRIKTNDWLFDRGSNVFYLGDHISIEASIRTGHHTGLRVFLSSCVATLDPDVESDPGYVLIQNGCLVDSQLPDSRSHFVSRTQDDTLRLVVDAFNFHQEDTGELYITCLLSAVPVNDAQAPNKACTFINGRWRSADGNDYLCGQCRSQNDAGSTHSKPIGPAQPTPRGFGKPEYDGFWRSGYKTGSGWGQEARLGPVQLLPNVQRSRPLPVEELPDVLNKISKPMPYGSQWRGLSNLRDLEKGLLPGPEPSSNQVEVGTSEQSQDVKSGKDPEEGEEAVKAAPVIPVETEEAALDVNDTAALSDISTAGSSMVDEIKRLNEPTRESGLSVINDPKR